MNTENRNTENGATLIDNILDSKKNFANLDFMTIELLESLQNLL